MTKLRIAVDGTASAGKGTVCQALAKELNLDFLSSGLVYRATAYAMIRDGISTDDNDKAVEYAQTLKDKISSEILNSPDLRREDVGEGASKISSIPALRKALFDYQVNFMNNPPEDKDGSIIDGRDIGTVICPESDVKIFIDADVEVRAERRYKEILERGKEASLDAVLKDMKIRDERDIKKQGSPLVAADDAFIIDTTNMSIEEVVKKAREIVNSKLAK